MQYRSRCTVPLQFCLILPAGTRSRPIIHSYPTLVSTNNGLKPHLANATRLINHSLSSNTLKAYPTAWYTYRRFLATCPGTTVDDVTHVLAFISYCHTQLALPHTPIRLYLAGIQATMSFILRKTQQTGPGVDINFFRTSNALCPATIF